MEASTSGGGGDTSSSSAGSVGPVGDEREVLLQAFNWECHNCADPSWWTILKFKAGAIADAGITCVWLPPPSASVSPEGYMPGVLEDLNSKYGTEQELRECIQALHSKRITVIADVVINHRCAGEQGEDGNWNQFTGKYSWDRSHITRAHFGGTGAEKEGDLYDPAPNVDHRSAQVRKDIKDWLMWLRTEIGFDGWRIDFAKGYAPQYVAEYISHTDPHIAIGEFWTDCEYDGAGTMKHDQDPHRQRIVNWMDGVQGKSAAFDFTTKGILQQAVEHREYWRLKDAQGRAPGVIGFWARNAVTFVDNHDTASTQNNWPFPSQHLHQGYAYILTHPGTPCVFWDHLFTEGVVRPSLWRRLKSLVHGQNRAKGGRSWALRPLRHVIIHLIRIRRTANIRSSSQLTIHEARQDCYAATVDERLAVKLGPGYWAPSQIPNALRGRRWTAALTGYGFKVWLSGSEDASAILSRRLSP